MPKQIAILGSTGSIGRQTLDVVRETPDIVVTALSAHRDVDTLEAQVAEFRPRLAAMADESAAAELQRRLPGIAVFGGSDGVRQLAADCEADLVVSAIVGAAGLASTLAAVETGKAIGLANKETLVAAGELVCAAARRSGVPLLPIDSEHCAIFQCLAGEDMAAVARLILTASGGPFANSTMEELAQVDVRQALRHPTWVMGQKITIDSATLMNKGLEIIEAHYLFGVAIDRIDVVVHPQSIAHSFVEFVDGSIKAQLGLPNMRHPIQYALTYPHRASNSWERLSLADVGALTFTRPDVRRFRCLALARQAAAAGGTAPAVMNAANEIAVHGFLGEQITFLGIADVVDAVLQRHEPRPVADLPSVLDADAWGREQAAAEVERRSAAPS